MQRSLLKELDYGDMRTIGKSEKVVKKVLEDSNLFGEVFLGLSSDNKGLRMRAADVLERVSSKRPELLAPFKEDLINKIPRVHQNEVKWHLAQMYSYINLNNEDKRKVSNILFDFLNNTNSNIVKVFCLETLYKIALEYPKIKNEVLERIKHEESTGSPAVRARARILLRRLEK